ncbi:MAG: DMT family transporter [Eubacteriales bacterium]|nr:DMT family transporter [Eubacteriales bacterium]
MPQQKQSNAAPILSVLGALILWSSSFVAIKVAYTTYPPITLAVARFVVATLILGLLTLLPGNRVRLERRDIFTLAVCGLTGIMLYAILQNIAMQWTSASSATLIIASYPIITLLLESLIYKIKLSAVKIVAILIAIVGVVILSYVKAESRLEGELLGILLLVAAGVVWAVYNFMTKKVINRYPPITLLFYSTLFGTILMLPLALLERGQWQQPTLMSFSMMMFLGVFCSVIAFLLYNRGLKTMSASTVTSMLNLMPIFGVFFSYILLGEQVSTRKFIGGAIVILGVMLSVRSTKTENEKEAARKIAEEAVQALPAKAQDGQL